MSYALNIDKDNRILSVTYEKYATPAMPLVDALPDGNVNDYLYVDGQYVYDPLPKPRVQIIASDNYMEEEIFSEDGDMYVATQTILRGEEIIPNTNCIPTTIIEQLKKVEDE